MQKLILIALAVSIISCGKKDPPPGPADAVKATFTALEAHDSLAFIQSLSQDKRDIYSMNPERVTQILDNWKGNHATITVLAVKQTDSTATVLYNLNVTGAHPHTHDSILTRLNMEGGSWKHGY